MTIIFNNLTSSEFYIYLTPNNCNSSKYFIPAGALNWEVPCSGVSSIAVFSETHDLIGLIDLTQDPTITVTNEMPTNYLITNTATTPIFTITDAIAELYQANINIINTSGKTLYISACIGQGNIPPFTSLGENEKLAFNLQKNEVYNFSLRIAYTLKPDHLENPCFNPYYIDIRNANHIGALNISLPIDDPTLNCTQIDPNTFFYYDYSKDTLSYTTDSYGTPNLTISLGSTIGSTTPAANPNSTNANCISNRTVTNFYTLNQPQIQCCASYESAVVDINYEIPICCPLGNCADQGNCTGTC